ASPQAPQQVAPAGMNFGTPVTQPAAGQAATGNPETAGPGVDASVAPSGTATVSPGPAAGANAPQRLEQTWTEPEPPSLQERTRAVEAAQRKLEGFQTFDPMSVFKDNNLQQLADYWNKFAGPRPDYSKVQASIQEL